MKRELKKRLSEKLRSLNFVISDASGACGVDEKIRASNSISRRAREMMIILEEVTVQDQSTEFVIVCEGSVDRATTSVGFLVSQINRLKEQNECRDNVSYFPTRAWPSELDLKRFKLHLFDNIPQS